MCLATGLGPVHNRAFRTSRWLRHAGDAQAGQGRPLIEVLLDASTAVANASDPNARPYSLPWPLPCCASGACRNASRDAAALAAVPWAQWSEGEQMEALVKLFPGSASRVVNVVSDECMIKSQLNFYGLVGPEWQTEGFSTHVDWSRSDNAGHPGSFSRPMLIEDPGYIRRVRLPLLLVSASGTLELQLVKRDECDEAGNTTRTTKTGPTYTSSTFKPRPQAAAL